MILINKCKQYLTKYKWRKTNKHNSTFINRVNDINNIEIGNYTYGELNVINYSDNYKLRIGHFCSIAPNVTFVVCGDHDYKNVSTFPFKVTFGLEKYEAISKGDIIVEDDVWFGVNSTILSGVHIGRGAVIGACSLVTKDVPDYSVVVGNPAKVINYRFDDKKIEEASKLDFASLKKEDIIKNINFFYHD